MEKIFGRAAKELGKGIGCRVLLLLINLILRVILFSHFLQNELDDGYLFADW